MKPNVSKYSFIAILVVLNLTLAFYATPVTDLGDANSYILLSKTFLGKVTNHNLQSRSPLFSLIMAGFMLIFKAPILYKVMIIFQYMLVAVTSWLVYLLFRRLFEIKEIAMLVALLFNLSLSTIYFANILLTETLSVFLLVLTVFLLLRIADCGGVNRVFSLGVLIGLLSLARFNSVPLIITFVVLLGYLLSKLKISVIKWLYFLGIFIFSYALILNLWCLYNYQYNGDYRIFPGVGAGIVRSPRNIIIASIRPGNKVSEANKPLLEIFLKAREEYLSKKIQARKGSLANLDKAEILSGLYSGYPIYKRALPELKEYYNGLESTSKAKKRPDLNDFLSEIAAQNTLFIWKYRFYSLLSGFRASSPGTLPFKFGSINLNILPSPAFIVYKLLFIFISVFVFFAFFFFIVSTVKANFKPDFTLLTMFFVVFSFWGINFIFSTVNDANRYKYPAEPLIIGLFIYYVFELINWIKVRKTHFN
ncbi:MAG: glycosyltransferase family 39 protein [Syntrophaceae bacterium]|nr:glycosyltransferase family 39 protein [Syntrophaceae bacterium]